jgi:predicted dienelactone hydrolase
VVGTAARGSGNAAHQTACRTPAGARLIAELSLEGCQHGLTGFESAAGGSPVAAAEADHDALIADKRHHVDPRHKTVVNLTGAECAEFGDTPVEVGNVQHEHPSDVLDAGEQKVRRGRVASTS